jgi:hypothetical protein
MPPVQSLNNCWFDIIDVDQKDIDNIYLVPSSDKTKKSSRAYREPNKKNGIRYAVTGLYFSKFKDDFINNMKVSKKC